MVDRAERGPGHDDDRKPKGPDQIRHALRVVDGHEDAPRAFDHPRVCVRGRERGARDGADHIPLSLFFPPTSYRHSG